jgi:hypothetical protein
MSSDKEIWDDILLASEWPISRVQTALRQDGRSEVVAFVYDRHYERFFKPIDLLKKERDETFGFAIMALCSLLIETLQCYREGWPSTNGGELTNCRKDGGSLDGEYRLDDLPEKYDRGLGKQVFESFFKQYRALFPGIDGKKFYENVRNGLLHQAQTKGGWRIRTGRTQLWDEQHHIIDRNLFVCALEAAFNNYLEEVREDSPGSQALWKKARRKILWLIELSKDRG